MRHLIALILLTLPYTPEKPTRPPVTRSGAFCLAMNIYHEARGEPIQGQRAVGHVTINRTLENYRGARSICETVFMPKQFSWTHQPTPQELAPYLELAKDLLSDPTPPAVDALHYYNPTKADPYWKDSYRHVATLGNHRFLK